MLHIFNHKLEQFDDTAIPGLHAAVKAIPQEATQLDLSGIEEYATKRQQIITEILKVLPPTIAALRPGYAFDKPNYNSPNSHNFFLKLLPNYITALRFALPMEFELLSTEEQITYFTSIPYSVTAVNISGFKAHVTDLVKITNTLPAHVTQLALTNDHITEENQEESSTFIAQLPANLSSLTLQSVQLTPNNHGGPLNIHILGQIIKAIPKNITSLNLHYNFFDNNTPFELATIFKQLPSSITTLDLSTNFYNLNGNHAQLVALLNVLPANLKTLILKDTHSAANTEAQIEEIYKALPRELTALDLSENELFKDKTIPAMVSALRALPSKLTSLYLNENKLNALRTAELGLILSSLPDSLTSVHLEDNELHTKSGSDLAFILGSLCSRVTAVSLGKNGLHNKTGSELAQAFKGISSRVTSLNLSHNKFHEMPQQELVIALKALHKDLNSLNFSHNRLHQKTPAELSSIFQVLPAELTSLDLSHNGFYLQTAADLTQVFTALPDSIKTLTLSVEDIAMRSEEELEAFGKALPHVMKVQICDPLGNLVSHASLDTLKLHIGGWIRESNAQTQHLLKLAPLANIIEKLATNTDASERKSFIDEQDRERKCQSFSSHLKIIYFKAEELQRRGYIKESCELHTLQTHLRTLKDQYCQGLITSTIFKEKALPKIKEARPTLETHRGGKEIYMNILWFILGLAIGYIAFCVYKGRFFKCNTDSADKLNDLEKNLNTGILQHAL